MTVPYSDVDLLLLVEEEVHGDTQREALSAFLRDFRIAVSGSVNPFER